MAKRVLLTTMLLLLGAFLMVAGVVELAHDAAHPVSFVGAILLTVGFWALIRNTEPVLLLRLLDGLRLFLPIATFVLTMQLVGEPHGTLEFDEVGAQIIAVFLLALALEARFFRLHRVREPLDLAAALFTMVILGSGELYALQGIATGRPEHAGLIGGAVAAGFVAVAIAALTGPGPDSGEGQA